MRIKNKDILELVGKTKETDSPQFSLDDLVGKTIQKHRKIKNPEKVDRTVTQPNPEYFNVLIFSDATFLLTAGVGYQAGTELRSYYFNGKEVRYSNELF